MTNLGVSPLLPLAIRPDRRRLTNELTFSLSKNFPTAKQGRLRKRTMPTPPGLETVTPFLCAHPLRNSRINPPSRAGQKVSEDSAATNYSDIESCDTGTRHHELYLSMRFTLRDLKVTDGLRPVISPDFVTHVRMSIAFDSNCGHGNSCRHVSTSQLTAKLSRNKHQPC